MKSHLDSSMGSVAKRENVPPTIDTPKNCLPFYKNQIPLHKLIIASYRAVPRYPLFATLRDPRYAAKHSKGSSTTLSRNRFIELINKGAFKLEKDFSFQV